MRATFLTLGCFAGLCLASRADSLQCFSPGETRERIRAEGLAEPFGPMQKAAAHLQAEALGARLCRGEDSLVYEVNLLRRDGKIIRAVIDARSGQILDTKKKDEPRAR